MIAPAIKKDLSSKIGLPRVITSDAQNERYTQALLDFERQNNLSADEKNLARGPYSAYRGLRGGALLRSGRLSNGSLAGIAQRQ